MSAIDPVEQSNVDAVEEAAPRTRRVEHKIFHDHFQNYKRHSIQKAQLVIADIPYNIGKDDV